MNQDYRPRFQVDISIEHAQKLNKYLDYGMRKAVVNVFLEDLFSLIETHGAGPVIGLFVSRSISLKDVCKIKPEV